MQMNEDECRTRVVSTFSAAGKTIVLSSRQGTPNHPLHASHAVAGHYLEFTSSKIQIKKRRKAPWNEEINQSPEIAGSSLCCTNIKHKPLEQKDS
jgi:hypothetical protein